MSCCESPGDDSGRLVARDRAVGAALMLHASSVIPTLALGFLFLIQDGLDFGSMQKLATAAAEGESR